MAGAPVTTSRQNMNHAHNRPDLGWSWERRDHHQVVTSLAGVALAIAAGMALFGLPPVDLHGPLHYIGIMDPLCGGTRAARYTAQGQLGLAWKYNPLGILVVIGAAVVVARTLVGVLAGRWLTVHVGWSRRHMRWVIAVAGVLLIILEVRQQLRADLLIASI